MSVSMSNTDSQNKANLIDTLGHIAIVVLVIVSATYLAVRGDIKADTIATVYGAALGFTTGAAISRRPVTVRTGDTTLQGNN